MRNILVIVDFQKDFYHKTEGSLYVNGAENCVNKICDEIKSGKYQRVILTCDWHRVEDKSFKENGGQWPVHCIQYSEGASIHPEILNTIISCGTEYNVFLKGNCPTHEEYMAFERIDGRNTARNWMNDSIVLISPNDKFTLCGLAGDICVWETYKNMKNSGLDVTPFYDGMAFINEKFDFEEEYSK